MTPRSQGVTTSPLYPNYRMKCKNPNQLSSFKFGKALKINSCLFANRDDHNSNDNWLVGITVISINTTTIKSDSGMICFDFLKNAIMGSTQSIEERQQNHERRTQAARRPRQSSVFLRGCDTDEEHKLRKNMMIGILRALKGKQGLEACGLEYRLVTIGEDGKLVPTAAERDQDTSHFIEEKKEENLLVPPPELRISQRRVPPKPTIKQITMTRMFDTESNTMITSTNRKEFIADGAMYDIVCRLATEYSQDVMVRDGELEWVNIPEEDESAENQSQTNKEPIRALVSKRILEDASRLDTEPTLLVVTGKGRVRTGIFSRQHLLTSGLECSSSVQFIQEARKRGMNLMILDPNARGDRFGMQTFEKSMAHLFRRWEEVPAPAIERQPTLYLLSHSQSGAQFVRYLLRKADSYLAHINAIAFTDSTHNIQWAKRQNVKGLEELLESEKSIYFKRTDDIIEYPFKPFKSIGSRVDTDQFWEHRFGKIRTICAGTSEHSLVNWFARNLIWDHFDQFLKINS